jgi:hypothetical protein
MTHQFNTLTKALDTLCLEAPKSYTSYHPDDSDHEGLCRARGLAYIHLLFKVRFGIADFLGRHKFITEGTQDGGVDAYFIDTDRKKLFLIQSKFRTTSKSFRDKVMDANDLIKMEVQRITKGLKTDSRDVPFNSKIVAFQNTLNQLRDIAKYDFIVIFLGDVNNYSDDQLRKLIDNCEYEKYDAQRAYEKLLFPLTTGTYFDPDEIEIRLDLAQKTSLRLNQYVDTDFGQYNVTAVFVPTSEIGRVMSKYKNAILKFNPRNFLSLRKNSVNGNIRRSIIEQKKNNFALLNNGITILSDKVAISESTGAENVGQMILTRPQILNGGQTAFTLSAIYDEHIGKEHSPLTGKEVLVKIITPTSTTSAIRPEFIELISNATNQQNEVSEADRRANHEIQVSLQSRIFTEYGYFYERKAGEFHDGLNDGLIDKNYVIDRLDFIKAYWAYRGEPAAARRTSEKNIFQEEMFYHLLSDTTKYVEMFFAFLLFKILNNEESKLPNKSEAIKQFGHSLMYGKWAVIASIGITQPIINSQSDQIYSQAQQLISDRLTKWNEFDYFVQTKRDGSKYFEESRTKFDLYYKVNLLDEDIREYFLK